MPTRAEKAAGVRLKIHAALFPGSSNNLSVEAAAFMRRAADEPASGAPRKRGGPEPVGLEFLGYFVSWMISTTSTRRLRSSSTNAPNSASNWPAFTAAPRSLSPMRRLP